MAKRIRPITSLLKQGVKFVFTPAMENIVREQLAELSTPPVLVYPNCDVVTDNSRPFLFYCDASMDSFGATLEQEQENLTIHPIVFTSRVTIESERQWTPIDLEAGSIVWSVKYVRGYLWGTTFRILSDHKELEILDNTAEQNPRVQQWISFLTAYNYTLEYRKGSANRSADFLPRLTLPATELDRSGPCSLLPSDEKRVFLIRSYAYFWADPPPCTSAWVGWRPPTRALA